MDEYHNDNTTLLRSINEQLAELNIIVNTIEPENLPKVKRYGLDPFEASHLWQFGTYLEGLSHMKVTPNTRIAFKKFVKSLQNTTYMCNEITRKTLVRMHELLMIDRKKKMVEVKFFNLTSTPDTRITDKNKKNLRNSTANEEIFFRSSLIEDGLDESPDGRFERRKQQFKKSLTEDPKKLELEVKLDIIKRKIDWV